MNIEVLTALGDNYIYLLHEAGHAAAIDPGEARGVLAALKRLELTLDTVFITHGHGDHTAGCRELKAATGCKVIAPSGEHVQAADIQTQPGTPHTWNGHTILTLGTPGHTHGHVTYHLPDLHTVFTGDTLFCAGCGRPADPASYHQLWESLQLLRAMPETTEIYCGHEYTVENLEFAIDVEPNNHAVRKRLAATREQLANGHASVPSRMADERLTNPFLRADEPELHVALDMQGADSVEVFTELRRRKNRW